MTKPMTIDCPTCGTAVQWDTTNAFRPFCSDRCKLIDLGAWPARSTRSRSARMLKMICFLKT